MTNPLVSIIIPAYNEEKVIANLLTSISKQSYHNIEIVVVDDASSDNTPQIAKKYTESVYTRPHFERSVQRNFGAKKTKGKYLLVLDADMELESNVVRECVILMKRDRKYGLITIPEVSVANTFWERVKAFERSFYNIQGDVTTDAGRFFDRLTFEKVGGYDETITGPEDWDLPERILKAGYKQGRIKSKIFHYERVPNPLKLAKKKYYYALTSHRYLKKHGTSPFSKKTIYFLRPVFYKNWKILTSNPLLSIAMFFMLTLEQIGGGLGYLVGKYKKL